MRARPRQNPKTHFSSGGERTRTADFYVANVALYHLSYTPACSQRLAAAPSMTIRISRANAGCPEDQEECLINGMPKRLGAVVVVVVAAPPVPEFTAVIGKVQVPETQS